MSTLVVEVCAIDRILPHTNADALELAHIKGWQCVVPKGRYKAGDPVIYAPVDSVLPELLSNRLGVTKYLSKGRVRCARLRGEPSFGLVFDPEPGMRLGDDVRDQLGITKYTPPLRPSAGDAEEPHPLFVQYTGIENLRNFPDVLYPTEVVEVTEKIHGTNCRVGLIDGQYMAGSMGVRRREPTEITANNLYWWPMSLATVKSLLHTMAKKHKQVILFGEVYGPKVQGLHYGVPPGSLGFAAFDLLCDGRYQDPALFRALCSEHQVPTVPLLRVLRYTPKAIRELGTGPTTTGGSHIREGVIVKPLIGRTDPKIGRVILKFINDDYLLHRETGKVTETADV